ncbi:MAG: PIN domain-containing protein [Anaerolineae bacterium]|nr:PIN domain-containing protein [Anaerolineae bacterium]
MPETVFWDTSAFVALGNADDNLHEQAAQVSEVLGWQRAHILTTSAVLTEVANTFSKSVWRPVAQHFLDSVHQSVAMGLATVVHIDAALWERGWALFVARPDKDWGLTDCISFVVMQDRRVMQAFTSDHHFEQAGFNRLMKS